MNYGNIPLSKINELYQIIDGHKIFFENANVITDENSAALIFMSDIANGFTDAYFSNSTDIPASMNAYYIFAQKYCSFISHIYYSSDSNLSINDECRKKQALYYTEVFASDDFSKFKYDYERKFFQKIKEFITEENFNRFCNCVKKISPSKICVEFSEYEKILAEKAPDNEIEFLAFSSTYSSKEKFYYFTKTSPSSIDYVFKIPQYKKSISIIGNRIKNLGLREAYSIPDLDFDFEKEQYFLNSFCTKEAMGHSADFFYNWFSTELSLKNSLSSGDESETEILKEYNLSMKKLYSTELIFAGEFIPLFISNYFYTLLKYENLTKNSSESEKLYNEIFAIIEKLNIWELYSILSENEKIFPDSNFTTKKFIIDLWNHGYSISQITNNCGLSRDCHTLVQEILLQNKSSLIINSQAAEDDLNYDWKQQQIDWDNEDFF